MLRRHCLECQTTDGRAIPPIHFPDPVRRDTVSDEPGLQTQWHEVSGTVAEPLHGRDVEVVVVIVTDDHDIDRRQDRVIDHVARVTPWPDERNR